MCDILLSRRPCLHWLDVEGMGKAFEPNLLVPQEVRKISEDKVGYSIYCQIHVYSDQDIISKVYFEQRF